MGGKPFRFASIVLIALTVASPGVAAAASPGCKLAQMAELPVTMEGLTPTITATVNGRKARFIVDSGAFFSLVTPRAAEKLKMSTSDLPFGFNLQGAVGSTSARLGKAADFELDHQALKNLDFLIAGDSLGDADGLLGQNILGVLDVEYDFANGVVRIFKPIDCDKAMLAYWVTNLAAVSVMPIDRTTPAEPLIYGRAIVNDLPIRIAFDTGAGRSILKLNKALQAGAKLDAEDASVDDAMKGIGRRSTDSYILPFASFELGNETIKNIRLRVGRSDFTGADMLLGADFFLSHRVFVAQSQHRLYFTYNGGPVFRLDDDGVWSKPFASTAVPSDPRAARTVATSAAAAQDVSVLRRHAAAAAARRDFNGAIRDLDQAIAVEPDNPDLYLDRARWKLSSSAGADGMGDLDKALKLKPDYAEALVARGHLRLAAGKVEQADDDFAAAFKAGPEQPDLELQIAEAYSKTRHFDRAVARYDAWIAQNPQSFDFDKALNGRCWARALWGRELDKALVDCDQALRRGSRLASVYDSRGMVHLRRGEFAPAVTDYTAALKLQPKAAASLYGRGLARLKAGDTAGGEADLRAATAIEPKIAEWMAGYGITASTVVVANS